MIMIQFSFALILKVHNLYILRGQHFAIKSVCNSNLRLPRFSSAGRKLMGPKAMHKIDLVGSTSKDALSGRINVEEDRLSSLPEDLIHKILSFVSMKHAVRTSVLSSRWRLIWTSMPYLNFNISNVDFFSWYTSYIFVSDVLSHRNNQTPVSSVELATGGRKVSYEFVKKVLNYAVSHNVEQLTVTCDLETNNDGFPLSLFSCKSLKNLALDGLCYTSTFTVSPAWKLPALTTLHLDRITLSDEHHTDKCIGLFSSCINLKSLSLRRCNIIGMKVFNVFHPGLLNLKLEDTFRHVEVLNVVTPQLKNLTIRFCYGKHVISAPGLTSLVLVGERSLEISTQGFPCLEKVHLFIPKPCSADAHKIVCMLQQLHTVKFLELNLQIIEFLSSSTEQNSHQPFVFPNLKISKFLPVYDKEMVYLEVVTQEKVTTSTDIKNLDTLPPNAIFTMVSCQEIKVMRNMVFAQKLIGNLRFSLKYTNNAHMASRMRKNSKVQVKKQGVQSAFEMQWHFGEMMGQIEQGKIEGLPTLDTRYMISQLQCIEGLVTELPASKRAAMQAAFCSICEEAGILMNDMMDVMNRLQSLD